MKTKPPAPQSRQSDAPAPFYRFRLFVAGEEPNSCQARATLERLCANHLHGRCDLQVVDVFADYQAALDHGVIVVPTLIVEEPPPARTLVGSLDDPAALLALLGLPGKEERT